MNAHQIPGAVTDLHGNTYHRIVAGVALLNQSLGHLTKTLVELRTVLDDDSLYNSILTEFENQS